MPQLRWTLLFLGVLFLILLVWIERRRQRQTYGERRPAEREPELSETTFAGAFREPTLNLPEMRARDPGPPQELPVVEIEEDSLNARRLEVGEPLMDPPTLSLPVVDSGLSGVRGRSLEPTFSGTEGMTSGTGFEVPRLDTPAKVRAGTGKTPGIDLAELAAAPGDEAAFNEAVFGDPSLAVDEGGATGSSGIDLAAPATDESWAADVASPEPAVLEPMSVDEPLPAAPVFTPAEVALAEPIVEWPPDDQRRLVALRLIASPPERIPGRALRLALASEGFVLGRFSIFHKPDDQGRAVLSAASLTKPGTFEIDTMDLQRYGGLSLFAVLPGPKPPLKAFEDLLTAARNLNERLQGALQDERGGPLTPARIAALRESLGAAAPS